MVQSLGDIWVFSDMDGTLLDDEKQISKANLESIRLFTMLGGRFSIATERCLESIDYYTELMPYLSISIGNSGCSIYDPKTNFYCQNGLLPIQDARRIIWDILRHFRGIGVLIMGEDGKNYQLGGNEELCSFLKEEKITYLTCPFQEIPGHWNKVIFTGSKEQLAQLEYYISKRGYLGVYFSKTASFCIEMLPKKVTKGSALTRICDITNYSVENVFAIGNGYNDIELLELAGHSVAMENSPKDIKMITDTVTGKNTESGVGQFLYNIIRKYEK